MDATLVKVGGSLALQPGKLRFLCNRLSDFSKKGKVVVVPGGGQFADVVRDVDSRFSLSPNVSHRMAVLGMNQYGLLLSDLISNSVVVDDLSKINGIINQFQPAIVLPSMIMESADDLESSWDVTSDAISVHIAGRLSIKRVLLVTDVDGIYEKDPKKHSNLTLLRQVSAKELLNMDSRTCVDKVAPKLAAENGIECFVVNGLFPERVLALLEGKSAVATKII
jgi:aspartokinase-like uncharacterized kinase